MRLQQFDVNDCEKQINAAIGMILAEEASPNLERIERFAEEYRATRLELKSLQTVLDSPLCPTLFAISRALTSTNQSGLEVSGVTVSAREIQLALKGTMNERRRGGYAVLRAALSRGGIVSVCHERKRRRCAGRKW